MTDRAETPKAAAPRRRGLHWSLLRISSVLAVVYFGLVGCVMMFEDRLIYYPAKHPEGFWQLAESTAHDAPKVEDIWLTTSDGVKVHGWYCSPRPRDEEAPADAERRDDDRPVVLWFHGNAGNLTHRYDSLAQFMRVGIEVFIVDYRGYGRSEGSPSEEGLYRDARAAWDYLVDERGVPADRIVLFGKSLGAAPAIELATQVKPAGLIVESAFTSVPDMAGQVMPLIPRFAVRTKMDSINKVGDITCPKLFTHSPSDEIIPYSHGQRLYEAAAEPKRFYEVRGAGHNDMHEAGGLEYWRIIDRFIRDCVRR